MEHWQRYALSQCRLVSFCLYNNSSKSDWLRPHLGAGSENLRLSFMLKRGQFRQLFVAFIWEGCDFPSALTNLDHRARVQTHLMNWNPTSSPWWFRAHWRTAYVCFLLCDQAEVTGRADHHHHPIKHITADPPPDPPHHFFDLCTMEGQSVGNLRPRVALLSTTGLN